MEQLPLSLLNDYLYCPRRAALKLVEGWRGANEHTARGDIVHEHADLPGYEVAKGTLIWRGLPVWSERLGLSGRCDIVEAECGSGSSAAAHLKSEISNLKSLKPVEYKKGKRRRFENDDAQLCAQALCLEEMFGVKIDRGAVFHAESKRRRDVEFTVELRGLVERAVAELRELIDGPEVSDRERNWSAGILAGAQEHSAWSAGIPAGAQEHSAWSAGIPAGARLHSTRSAGIPAGAEHTHHIASPCLRREVVDQPLPAAVFKPACEECSLFEICLPRVTSASTRAERMSRALYEI
jgi:CRISPR-associated exonuclease Cas4